MSTEFSRSPTLVDRLVGARLVALGVVRGVVDVRPDEIAGGRVLGTVEIEILESIRGKASGGTVLVRVVGEGDEKRPRWIVPTDEGATVLWLLTPDVGPGLEENLYAPVFAGAFVVDDEGVHVPSDALDDVSQAVTGAETPPISLELFRRLDEEIERQRQIQLRRLNEIVPREAQEAPYPLIQEMPQDAADLVPRIAQPAATGGQFTEITERREPDRAGPPS